MEYIKDGIIKTRNQIVLHGTRIIKDKDGNDKEVRTQTINPTEEQLLADGWEEYVAPVVEQREVSEEQKAKAALVRARHKLRNKIQQYDSSSEVNCFHMQGQQMWLDKATRAGLMLRFQSEIAAGREKTTLWYDGKHYELPLSVAMQMLYAIELYASQCYDVTQAHLAAIQELQTIEEIESYDYTQGYPAKLEF